ncbi:MAG: AmmeMemoRadiSam system protein B [Deltaproteobacteria bacterium]|nr:AmmeMemoRadiSam system protein B [Deltaproteobacteria bacterium]
MEIRKADFAGSWYPGRESECLEAIAAFSKTSIPCPRGRGVGIGGIVPHAGWYYSGSIAYNVIKCLESDSAPDTFVIFGKHLHPGSNNYIMREGGWATPLGDLEIDHDFAERLLSEFRFTVESASRYEQDNTIELQLPFIKHLFPEVKILPIGVPPAVTSVRIGERVAEIAGDMERKIFVLGSTDLTHYGNNYAYAPKGIGEKAVEWVKNENDRAAVDLMTGLDAEGVIHESLKNSNTCCSGAVAAAIAAVKRLGARKGEKLTYLTSYDIRPSDSFVGYAGIIFFKESD